MNSAKRKRILVVDDDQGLLQAMRSMLEHHEHEVHTAQDARTALDRVNEHDYDLILADYKMPGEDGIWFMKNARLPKRTKVLLCTAYANRDVINKMFELGASGYLIKPFDEEEILRNISFHTS